MDRSPSLALRGGTPVIPSGPPTWPPSDPEVRAALEEAYADGSWGKYEGGRVEQLSERLAQYHGVAHALPCCSGTFAVELALRGLGISAGDEVVLAGYDFPGNFRAIEAVGAQPVLADIDPRTWSLDAASLEEALTPNVKGVIVSHLHGGLADMQQIASICRPRGVAIVEDICQSPGATVQGRLAGAWGDVGVLSFGGSKLLTAGRGGAIITDRADVAQRAKVFCERGNHAFPLAELQAAVLLPQLEKLSARNAIRSQRAQQLRDATRDLPGFTAVQNPPDRGTAAYYKFAWLYDTGIVGHERETFLEAIQAEGVAIFAGFRGFTGRSSRRCKKPVELEHSHRAARDTLILHHPVLLESPGIIDEVAGAMEKVVRLL